MVGNEKMDHHQEFEALLESNKGLIYKIAYSYCYDADDRKDLIQEIILQFWRAYPSFNGSVKLSTWMYRIALNVAISFYRKDSKRKSISTRLDTANINIAIESGESETENQISQLQQFIIELNSLDKALILLYLEDKNQKEIGEILGISETNVSTKIGRVKEKLRAKFQIKK